MSTPRKVPLGLAIPAMAMAMGLFAAACTSPAPGGDPSPTVPTTPSPAPPAATRTQPPPPLAWGPSAGDLEAATEEAAALADEDLAGLVIVARYEGVGTDAPARLLEDLRLGGVILFGPNIEGLTQVQGVGAAVQEAQAGLGRDWPAIVAVDNEGGRVQRLSGRTGPWTTFPPFSVAGRADAPTIEAAMAGMATELRASGINTNYAPVADVTGPGDAAIGDRSPSTDPDAAAEAVAAAVTGFAGGAILASVKHFPGHGGLATDSHDALPIQEATIEELRARDLPPFRAGIDAGVPMVMVGHIDVRAWEEGVPASLSAAAYDHLRTDLGFTGAAITDGLDMGALEGDSGEIAVRAMTAGADILLTPADPRAARDALLAALGSGELPRQRLVEAAGRIITMMRYQEHLAQGAEEVGDDDVGSARAAAQRLAGS